MNAKVCAVVVTYNRKALLRECLAGLASQTRPVDQVLVVDNVSTDGTRDMMRAEYPSVALLELPENVGGAGGFHEGMKWAYDHGYDWIWIMDDDAEPRPDTLAKLLQAPQHLPEVDPACTPLALCPVIFGAHTGGIQHWHHKQVDAFFRESFLGARAELPALLPIDGDAFVGPLFNRAGIAQVGLPRKEYFLWVDDLEYTYRYSQQGRCYLVRDAVMVHKDKPAEIAPVKRYYQQRNYTDFILRRAPRYARDRSALGRRRAAALWFRALASARVSGQFLKQALRGRGVKLSETLLPMLGLWHGLIGRGGKY